MNRHEYLKVLQAYPLQLKIAKSKLIIREMLSKHEMYASVSGIGSIVMNTLIQEVAAGMGIRVKSVYSDTGSEYSSTRLFFKEYADVVVRPKHNMRYIFTEYGYPIISKTQSRYIEDIRNPNVNAKMKDIRMNGSKKGYFKISEKWKYLLDADFKISNKCCYHLKKAPLNKYKSNSGAYPFIGEMAEESAERKKQWITHGCNITSGNVKSKPMSFWLDQDLLEYVTLHNMKYPPIYGDIIRLEDGTLTTTKESSTGCISCGYGAHMEEGENRFQRLKKLNIKQYNYIIGGGHYVDGWWVPSNQGLGLGHVLDAYGVKY